ncbi:MAG TPA: hypothetical protein DCR96_05570, partial [Hyphomonas sp.]|nr:hypothetical protein [Hyphomonas sp.]HAQ75941.1 hypothetical protein [Hyphomonas sp.]
MPRSKDILRVTEAVAAFGNRRLFGPLSFDIRGPERIAIAGPNGAGKSTLMRM